MIYLVSFLIVISVINLVSTLRLRVYLMDPTPVEVRFFPIDDEESLAFQQALEEEDPRSILLNSLEEEDLAPVPVPVFDPSGVIQEGPWKNQKGIEQWAPNSSWETTTKAPTKGPLERPDGFV